MRIALLSIAEMRAIPGPTSIVNERAVKSLTPIR